MSGSEDPDGLLGLDPGLLEIVVGPDCHAPLRVQGTAETAELACQGCGLVYPVRDQVPVLLIDEARQP